MAKGETREIRQIWLKYDKSRSESLRNLLMEHYLPLVKRIGQRIHAKLPREVELDDLVSAGTFGLMYAIAAFDLSRDVKFETYCANRIRGAILDELRSWDWVPRLARLRSARMGGAVRELKLRFGREPVREEIADHLGVSMEEMEKICKDGSVVRVMPLVRPSNGGEYDDERESPVLEDRRVEDRFHGVDRDDLREIIKRELSRAEQLIVTLYYFEQMTMKEIGATLDLSESRVSQMHSMILSRLQARLAARRTAPECMAA
jgi:RNA polymerase sigma factor for flagellar operon FliA